jgi:hypothetical protein
MCEFFSLVSDGNGKPMYFDWKQRKGILGKDKEFKDVESESPDSHTSIASFYGFKGLAEDKLNKYEYNPITKEFKIDQLNTTDDSCLIKNYCKELDFKTIVESLNLKKIVHPFKVKRKTKTVTKKEIELLKEWIKVSDSVRDSVWASVRDSVRASVGDSVSAPVSDSVYASVYASVWDSVWASVRDSVWASVSAPVRDSVRASVWASVSAPVSDSVYASVLAYISSFFNIKYKYDFSSGVKLWESGLVPSFDGTTWKLHGGNGKVLFTLKD